jgi:hypothetical protein
VEKDRFGALEMCELRAMNFVFKEAMNRGNVVPAIFWLNQEVLRELARRVPESPNPWDA